MSGNETAPKTFEKDAKPTAVGRSRRKRLFISCVVVVAVPILAWCVFRIGLRAKINAELDRIRAEGYPATVEELAALYPAPALGENAANVYRQAMAVAVTDQAAYKGLPFFADEETAAHEEPLSPEVLSRLESLAEDNREALRFIYEAAAMEECRFVPDLARVWMQPISLNGMKPWNDSVEEASECVFGMYHILAAEILLASERKDAQRVAAASAAFWRMGGHITKDPVFRMHAGSLFVREIHCLVLSNALGRTELGDAELERIAAYLSEPFDWESFLRCAVAQRCGGSALFTSPAGGRFAAFLNAYNRAVRQRRKKSGPPQISNLSAPVLPPPVSYRWRALGYLDLEHFFFLRGMRQYVGQWEQQARGQETPIVRRTGRIFGSDRGIGPLYFPFLWIFEFCWPTYYTTIDSSLCMQRLARTAVAVERFRNRNGRLPEALIELVPTYLEEVPNDYYGDSPVRYRRLSVGYVVYSVGEDLADDGGEQNSDIFYPDIVFRVAR